jgi:hypothetical protein
MSARQAPAEEACYHDAPFPADIAVPAVSPTPTADFPMRPVLFTLVLLATATAAAAAASDTDIKTKIVGNWADTDSCKDGYLAFNADGTFASKGPTGSPPEDDLTGTYSIVNGKLAGQAGAVQMPTVSVDFDGEKLIMGDGPDADKLVHCK